MSGFPQINSLLESGGFSIHYYVGRCTTNNFVAQCFILAGLSAVAVLIAATLDNTLFLAGRDVGLLEHPTIWAFIVLQIALPISIRSSLRKLKNPQPAARSSGPDPDFSKAILARLVPCMRLKNATGKSIAAACYTVGLTAFVWNSYQNQLPGVVVPFDFWDSVNHTWGFWVTRVYKLYLFVWLLPYVALVHCAILVVVLREVRASRLAGRFEFQPFHPDDSGGIGFVPGLVTTPIIVTLLAASIPVAAAFEVHRSLDVTPIIGVTIVIVGTVVAYVVPILHLRTDITAMKRLTIERIRLRQQTYYSRIVGSKETDFETLRRGSEALDYFEKICTRVNGISNFPHLTRLLKYVGLALTPSLASFALKLYETLSPTLIPLLKPP